MMRKHTLPIALVLSVLALQAALDANAVHAAPPKKSRPAPSGKSTAPSAPSALTENQRILHVLNRLGYGPRPGDVARIRRMGLAAYLNQQLAPEDCDDSAVDAKIAAFTSLQQSQVTLTSTYDSWQKEASRLERLRSGIQLALAEKDKPKTTAVALAAPTAPVSPPSEEVMSGGESMMSMDSMTDRASSASMNGSAARATAKRLSAAYEKIGRETQEAEMQRYYEESRRARGEAERIVSTTNTQLTASRMIRAVESKRQLREVLVDFWTNHFNIDSRKGDCRYYLMTYDRDVIRPSVLGRFRDLLESTAKSPAMLYYLDNYQSAAPPKIIPGKPVPRGGLNENYAREIMELHTLGVDGGYTQKDVTEVARCLTGWTIDRATGSFRFDPRRHDNGEKIVLGQTIPAGGGIEDGEKVLDILAGSPATMRHVSYQLCQRLVADVPPTSLVNKCVATWQRTGGNLRSVVRTIVTSPEFFDPAVYKSKYKSPLEFIVSAIRAQDGVINVPTGKEGPDGKPLPRNPAERIQAAVFQVGLLGQPLYQYQAPTGYPENSRKWMSSGAVIGRLNSSLNLAMGRVGGITFPAPETLSSGEENGVPVPLVKQIISACVNDDLSAKTRNALLAQYRDGAADAPQTPQEKRQEAQQIITFLIGSPDFQNH
jgi:uncharacterized protein (DUF1800 family)